MTPNELTVYDENIALKSVISDLKKNLGEYRELSAAKDKRIADDKFILYSLEATIKELEAEIERHKNKDWDKAEVLVTLRGLESDNAALKKEIESLKKYERIYKLSQESTCENCDNLQTKLTEKDKEIAELKSQRTWNGKEVDDLQHSVKVLREALERIANMPKYDQDDTYRLREKARQALKDIGQ